MKNNLSPLRYPGGKTQVYEFVRELIELNGSLTYIEPYMGGMGIALKLLLNNNVQKIMVNDYDKAIYAFWYSVLNYTDYLINLIETTPITIEEWKKQRIIQQNKDVSEDLLELGFSTLFLKIDLEMKALILRRDTTNIFLDLLSIYLTLNAVSSSLTTSFLIL